MGGVLSSPFPPSGALEQRAACARAARAAAHAAFDVRAATAAADLLTPAAAAAVLDASALELGRAVAAGEVSSLAATSLLVRRAHDVGWRLNALAGEM
jgi:hypothetical protein